MLAIVVGGLYVAGLYVVDCICILCRWLYFVFLDSCWRFGSSRWLRLDDDGHIRKVKTIMWCDCCQSFVSSGDCFWVNVYQQTITWLESCQKSSHHMIVFSLPHMVCLWIICSGLYFVLVCVSWFMLAIRLEPWAAAGRRRTCVCVCVCVSLLVYRLLTSLCVSVCFLTHVLNLARAGTNAAGRGWMMEILHLLLCLSRKSLFGPDGMPCMVPLEAGGPWWQGAYTRSP